MIREKGVEAALNDPPPWAVREFTPTERDQASLSVFEVQEGDGADSAAEMIAGAFAFHEHPIENKRWVFVGAHRADVEAEQLTILETNGTSLHSSVDPMHREIVVAGAEQLLTVARVFLKSNLFFSVEGSSAADAARVAARTDQFNYLKLYKRGDTTKGGTNLLRFVADQIVLVKGKPVAAS